MSSMVLSGDTSGAITLTVPAVAGTNTITLPAATGTVQVSNNMPAFSAYMTNGSANQSISSGVFTKVKIDTEIFDTNNNYDPTTNYRFQPTIAGFYQISASIGLTATAPSLYIGAIYKAGSIAGGGVQLQGIAGTATQILQLSQLQYLNGTTDYIELYGLIIGTSPAFVYGQNNSTFSAVLVRNA